MIVAECTSDYIDLEGGFWGLTSKEGNQYLPMNLPEQLKTKNLVFKVTLEPLDVMGMAMWGIPVNIISFTTS